MSKQKIYVASSWRNEYQPTVVLILLAMGFGVYDFRNPPKGTGFSWSEVDADWKKWSIETYRASLMHERAVDGFYSDFDAMRESDICVVVMPCGRSAHTEAGFMKGAGKKVFAYYENEGIEFEPELMYKLFDSVLIGLPELIAQLQSEILKK